jgi:hypothetical protein
MTGGNKNRFHQQLIAIGERFFASGTDAGGFDFDLIRELKTKRERVDYTILGDVSMLNGIGFQNYMQYLATMNSSIHHHKPVLSALGKLGIYRSFLPVY